jgi:hypothetical protein
MTPSSGLTATFSLREKGNKDIAMGIEKQKGLTKTEFLIVAVGFVAIAAYGVPAMINLREQSASSATDTLAGVLSSINAENLATRLANSNDGVAIANCKDLERLLPHGLSKGYSIKSVDINPGQSVNCTLKGLSATKARFTGTGIK